MPRLMWIWVAVLGFVAPVIAEDVYYSAHRDQITLTDGEWPTTRGEVLNSSVRIVMDSGEAYVLDPNTSWRPGRARDEAALVVKAIPGQKPSGSLYTRGDGSDEFVKMRFRIEAEPTQEAKERFYEAKLVACRWLQNSSSAGTAWFRYQADQASKELKPELATGLSRGWGARMRQSDSLLYDLFTGGRALNENLQLDRDLRVRPTTQSTEVDVESIKGISVAAMDFKRLLGDDKPKLDVLASAIPADQHAIFFSSMAAAFATLDQVQKSALPIIDSLSPTNQDRGLLQRYQRQLGLNNGMLSRLLGPKLVKSVAVTGSDPYFAMGTDVAVVFEAVDPKALEQLLKAQITLNTQTEKRDVVFANFPDGSSVGWRSPDRSICSEIATIGNNVIVTNSAHQMQRLRAVGQGEVQALADLPEYRFFRSRYRLDDPNETVFLVLSDATIRRWCSARWRIGDDRRTRELATAMDVRARSLDPAPGGTPDAGAKPLDNMCFRTPIAEMKLDKVSREEAAAYEAWRTGYQQNWRGTFDPIAIRLCLAPARLSGDMTIMPLIAATNYRDLIEASQGANLEPDSGDPHDALLHFVFALNRDSPPMRRLSAMGRSAVPGLQVDPFAWLGSSVAVYLDDDPYWDDVATADDPGQFARRSLSKLPVALCAQVDNPLKLAAFLTGVRAMVEQTAPGTSQWENAEYNGQTYVKITEARRNGRPADGEGFAIYYAPLPGELVVTPNEKTLKRAIDRSIASATTAPTTQPLPTTRPWLGTSAALQVRSRAVESLLGLFGRNEFGRQIQQQSWDNLPILNEWRRLYPKEDPVALHERIWGVKLVCPAGGRYVWNEQWQTMESTVTGHPAEPKPVSPNLIALRGFSFGNFGLSFENQGLRAHVELDIATDKERQARPAARPAKKAIAPAPPLSPEQAKEKCASNLRQIGQMFMLYANDHRGQYPETLSGMSQFVKESVGSPQAFVCPAVATDVPDKWPTKTSKAIAQWLDANCSYVYQGKGLRGLRGDPRKVLCYEREGNHKDGQHVLFQDGHVEFVAKAELEQLLAKQP